VQSLDLASGGRERVLDRGLDVHVAPVIGRLVADHDVLVGRNRYPDVDTIDGIVAVLRTRRDDGNTTPGNAVLVFLQPFQLMSNCCAVSRFRMRGLFSNSQQPPPSARPIYQRSNPFGSIVRIQQDQGSDRDDASENINPVFSQHDREVPTKFHIGCSTKHSEIIEE
jgi:hypothetical protein